MTDSNKNVDFADIDFDRLARRGMPETIFCPGKTAEQVAEIALRLKNAGQNVLATRASLDQYEAVREKCSEAVYHKTARIITIDVSPLPEPQGLVVVACAGTADLPVAEEAALTATRLGARVERINDAGVAGIHRIMKHTELLNKARAIVVVAGMEGALPSVVGGLVNKPIIAVPTSVGYGTSFNGLAALLTMLNTCVPGISVVNIDNGFGAGVSAAMINRTGLA